MIDTTTYRSRLEEEKAKLEKELLSVGRRNPTNPMDWEPVPQEVGQESDPTDRADLITHFEDNTAILKDLEIRYNQVAAAIDRIDTNTYGVCSISGEEIEEDRLNADPAATTCKTHLNA
ncbi:MAG: TraR/DksA family transcriptional regulator [Parcubacteria bacterium C7867-008]|nr:MAG: TraR/DksA family transcriptional regulator [Parcubacteria bacterium C7867-008]